MRILITNDDSINSPVLAPLAQWAQKLGEVTVVVPKFEQSGKSHSIELHKPFEVLRREDLVPGVRTFTVDSSPADCVRYAILGMGEKFDLVISGINRGLNIGLDIIYSGTAGAASEAVALGCKAIALSTEPESFDSAIAQLDAVWEIFNRHDLLARHDLYNVNIPLTVKGVRFTRQGGPYYSDDFPAIGNDLVRPNGKCVYEEGNDYTVDTHAVLHGYISISPLVVDRTAWELFGELNRLNPEK